MAKLPQTEGISFWDGKAKLTDGTAIKFPRQNLVPGLVVQKDDGTNLPNGTYPHPTKPGTFFTVKEGKVGQLNAPAPVEENKPDPIIEDAEKPKESEVKPDPAEAGKADPAAEIKPEDKSPEVVVTDVKVDPVV